MLLDKQRRRELIQIGHTDGLDKRGVAGLTAFIAAIATCFTYFFLPLEGFYITSIAVVAIVLLPHLYIIRDEEYQALSKEERKIYMRGFSYVIINNNLKTVLAVLLAFWAYLYTFGAI